MTSNSINWDTLLEEWQQVLAGDTEDTIRGIASQLMWEYHLFVFIRNCIEKKEEESDNFLVSGWFFNQWEVGCTTRFLLLIGKLMSQDKQDDRSLNKMLEKSCKAEPLDRKRWSNFVGISETPRQAIQEYEECTNKLRCVSNVPRRLSIEANQRLHDHFNSAARIASGFEDVTDTILAEYFCQLNCDIYIRSKKMTQFFNKRIRHMNDQAAIVQRYPALQQVSYTQISNAIKFIIKRISELMSLFQTEGQHIGILPLVSESTLESSLLLMTEPLIRENLLPNAHKLWSDLWNEHQSWQK